MLMRAFLASLVLATSALAQLTMEDLDGAVSWREVGPHRGGRVAAVCGIPQDRDTYWMGAAGGGVWKTRDAGRSWQNMSDGTFGGSIGAVAVSEWDPNVVYVGTGEKTVRGNVSHGDGAWRSTDAGRTWKKIGLEDSRHIARLRIHPKNPDVVYAAAMGHLFGPNHQRGVYRSEDGGETWEHVLFVSEHAGCVDLAMDPSNPRILYACFWRILRTPWSLESGGEGSGIWKSTDGGDSWTEITRNKGLPEGTIGISGISVSPTNPDNVYAIIEAEKGGVFRSRDAGKTWSRTNSERSLRQRAWYYTRLVADPANEDSVYVLNVGFHHSRDGGKTFSRISVPHGDNHDLWIDPNDPLRMIQSNDGGANVSHDGGKNWSKQDNQPTAQMYRVSTDMAFPYRLLGGQQDNSAVRIRSRSLRGGTIGVRDWEPTAGGESGHIVAKPDDPDVVFGGSYGGYLTRYNHRTGERRAINVWPDNPMGWGAAELKYRFQWNFPIFFSPHDPNVLYCAANVLFRSTDEGGSWEAISPDLTRNDKSKQGSSGGPITKDNTSVEYFCTIFAALESPHEAGVFWCGSDDGLIHLSRDGGQSWKNVTPPDMPEWMQINSIDAHPFEPGGLYVAGTRYKSDDFSPYLWVTTDWGATWRRITDGIPADHFTRVVRADPEARGVLYAGTERGVYVSWNDGGSWSPMQLNLPIVPITDLAVKEGDLVAATQGRGYWILDDLTPIRFAASGDRAAPLVVFPVADALRTGLRGGFQSATAGTNPRGGVVFRYFLGQDPGEDALKLVIQDAEGNEVRVLHSDEGSPKLPAEEGGNIFSWNMRYPDAKKFKGMVNWNSRLSGPMALPGRYKASMYLGERTLASVLFDIVPDPRSSATAEDRKAQFDFLLGLRDKLTETHEAIARLRDLRDAAKVLRKRIGDREEAADLSKELKGMIDSLEGIEKALYQTKNRSRQDPLNFPIRLNDKLAGVMGLAAQGDRAPTKGMREVRAALESAIDVQLAALAGIVKDDVPRLNAMVRALDLPALTIKSDDDEADRSEATGTGRPRRASSQSSGS